MRITATDALQILLRAKQPDGAALELTKAIRDNACQLWCNGNPVPINIKLTLAVEAHPKPEDQGDGWSATIVSTAREPWDHPSDYYCWEFDESEVAALLPPTSDREANDELRRTGSRMQALIRQIADEKWPDGWKDIPTGDIVKDVGEELKKRGRRVPSRDTFLRALGRRKG